MPVGTWIQKDYRLIVRDRRTESLDWGNMFFGCISNRLIYFARIVYSFTPLLKAVMGV